MAHRVATLVAHFERLTQTVEFRTPRGIKGYFLMTTRYECRQDGVKHAVDIQTFSESNDWRRLGRV
jgi:hypothetical protein